MTRKTCALLALCAVLTASGCTPQVQTPPSSAPERAPPAAPEPVPCTGVPPEVFAPPGKAVKTHSAFAKNHFRKRIKAFAKAPLNCGEIVLLGDSLTELNDWTASIPGVTLRNRGISGDTSDGVLVRMDELIASRPRAVFLLIGTNDLWTKNPPETTAANITKITSRIRMQSPDTLIFVQTVFPMRIDYAPNDQARAINTLLKAASRRSGIPLIDTYALVADSEGKLKAAYTSDGIHLNKTGNAAWSALILDTLRKHDLIEEAASPPE